MASRPGTTTIQLEGKTKDRLADIGKKNETYDDIINKLIDLWLKKKKR